jgi:predicted transposase YbfD/YdcC
LVLRANAPNAYLSLHAKDIRSIFATVADPRVPGRCLHQLSDILFIGLCTLLSHGEDFEDMVAFAEERLEWLKTKIALPNGVPSHDTFNRVFQIIDPKQLNQALAQDGQALIEHVAGQLICFDGKKLRGVSPHSRGTGGLYVLNAWASDQQLCIGQQIVGDKTNEITVIPELLGELSIQGSTISVDAIGCHTHIAEQIVAAQADYILAVKGNQGDLLEEVSESFQHSALDGVDEEWEYDHGRFENRRCSIIAASAALSPVLRERWPSIQTLIKIDATRQTNQATSQQSRYYISSRSDKSAAEFSQLIRSHWSIENQLHWHLDVTFAEDASRARRGNAPQNLSALRKMALHRVAKDDSKLSKKKRRFKAAMNLNYLEKILQL